MKLYNARRLYKPSAPNPRRVRIFLAEKGLNVPRIDLDLQAGETRTPEFRKLNSLSQTPVLELEDGGLSSSSARRSVS
jgi:glutathione S-transferase